MTQTTNSTCISKEGGIVIVVDNLQTYTSYEDLARLLELTAWSGIAGDLPTEGARYMIVREPHKHELAIYAIQDLKTEQEFLIHSKGIKHG